MKIVNLLLIFIFSLGFLMCFWFNFTNVNQHQSKKFVIGTHGHSGFFSIFLGALNKIIWAKKNDKIPVVYWTTDCLYYQKEGYHGSLNAWNYYFDPVSKLKYKNRDKIYRENQAPDKFCIPYWRNCYNDQFHKKLKFLVNDTIKKYIKIKPYIMEKVKLFYNKYMLGRKNIGIHLRGTDKRFEAKQVDPILIFNKAKEIAKKFPKKYQFFIATDDESLLNLAKKNLSNIIFCDSNRSADNKAIHYKRKIKPAILGEEVLIEALLLSKCDFFIHTLSNVATAVMCFNPKIKNTFLEA